MPYWDRLLRAPLSGSLLPTVCPNRLNPYLDRGGFAQVGRKISSRARSGGVMLVASMRRSRRIASGEIYGIPDLGPVSPRPSKTLKGVALKGITATHSYAQPRSTTYGMHTSHTALGDISFSKEESSQNQWFTV